MTYYVLVLLIAGHWMTVSDQNGNLKKFAGPYVCEAAYKLSLLLQDDYEIQQVQEHHCMEKTE